MSTLEETLRDTGSIPSVGTGRGVSRRASRRTLRPVVAFVGSALAFVAVAFSVGAPSPLFVLYQHEWGFADWMLTVAFGIYAITLLVTLLIAGSLSDHIGRRPVLIGGLGLIMVAMVVFLFAQDIGWIVVARAVQGVGTGAAMATFSAYLVELAPERHKKLGAVIGSSAPVGGIALGAFVTGLVVQFSSDPTVWIFSALVLTFVAAVLVVVASRETADRRAGAVRSLIPRLLIPHAARREFLGALPLLIAAWMLSGLFIGLAPSIVRGVFHLESGLVNGAVVALAPAAGASAGLLLSRFPARGVHDLGERGHRRRRRAHRRLGHGGLPLAALRGLGGGRRRVRGGVLGGHAHPGPARADPPAGRAVRGGLPRELPGLRRSRARGR